MRVYWGVHYLQSQTGYPLTGHSEWSALTSAFWCSILPVNGILLIMRWNVLQCGDGMNTDKDGWGKVENSRWCWWWCWDERMDGGVMGVQIDGVEIRSGTMQFSSASALHLSPSFSPHIRCDLHSVVWQLVMVEKRSTQAQRNVTVRKRLS